MDNYYVSKLIAEPCAGVSAIANPLINITIRAVTTRTRSAAA
jgi:hypothetical protein